MKKDKFFEELWDVRREAIARSDEKYLNEFKQRISKRNPTPNRRLLVFLLCFLFISSLALTILLTVALKPSNTIEYRTTERIIQKEPIIQQEKIINNITTYLQPENTANCIKVQVPGSKEYTMSCEEVKK